MNTDIAKQLAKHRRHPQPTVLIEGSAYTLAQIAERLGLAYETARSRLRTAQKLPGPVTWAKLGTTRQAAARSA